MKRLAAALLCFIGKQPLQPGVLSACLRTLRILSRDRQALGPLVTDGALLMLAGHGGITGIPPLRETEAEEESQASLYAVEDDEVVYHDANGYQALAAAAASEGEAREADGTSGWVTTSAEEEAGSQACCSAGSPSDTIANVNVVVEAGSPQPEKSPPVTHPSGHCRSPRIRGAAGAGGLLLARGKKDAREDRSEGGAPQEDGEVCRKEAMKTLCNVIYNSPEAQDRASSLR